MSEPVFTVDAIERDGSWFWFTTNAAGRLVLWNDEPFPSRAVAGEASYALHARWMRENNLTPYAGAI